MWILYQTALLAALLIVGPVLLVARRRHYLPTLSGRLGGHDGKTVRGAVWMHAVSVGEARVGGSLARRMVESTDLPMSDVLMTTVTPTGQAEAARQLGDLGVAAYLPFDLGLPVRRFLRRFEPRLCLLVEGDFWPLLLHRVRRRGVPIAVVNGHVGDRTFRRLRGHPRLSRWLYGSIERFLVQTERDRERLAALGVPAERVEVTGNLKFDAPVPAPSPEVVTRLQAAGAGRPLLIAGSTMEGEETLLFEAWRTADPDEGLLVVAPRHPERWDEVEQSAAALGLRIERRTEPPGDIPPQVLLLDTLGELAAAYGAGDAAFVGGTLTGTGGHNPIEPAVHGVPIAVGPSMENFSEIAAHFDTAEAWHRITDGFDLLEAWRSWKDGRGGALGRRGHDLALAHRGALDRTLSSLAPLLESVDVHFV